MKGEHWNKIIEDQVKAKAKAKMVPIRSSRLSPENHSSSGFDSSMIDGVFSVPTHHTDKEVNITPLTQHTPLTQPYFTEASHEKDSARESTSANSRFTRTSKERDRES